MDTETASAVTTAADRPAGHRTAGFDLDAAWALHPQVAVRPEPFGALLYHFGSRRLSFLKDPSLRAVVESLATHPSARAACAAAGITDSPLSAITTALTTLAGTDMIVERQPS